MSLRTLPTDSKMRYLYGLSGCIGWGAAYLVNQICYRFFSVQGSNQAKKTASTEMKDTRTSNVIFIFSFFVGSAVSTGVYHLTPIDRISTEFLRRVFCMALVVQGAIFLRSRITDLNIRTERLAH